MILGGFLAEAAGFDFEQKAGYVLFPLLVHTLDLIVSTVGMIFVSTKPGLPSNTRDYGKLENPLNILKRGYYVSLNMAIWGLYYICYYFLSIPEYPWSHWFFFGCACIGVLVSFLFIKITQYYTDYNFGPV
jgi:H+-translocating diphosphatase